MATMPAAPDSGQSPTDDTPAGPGHWFATVAGRAVLDSEAGVVADAISAMPAQPWLWLAPPGAPACDRPSGRGLHLNADGSSWQGAVRCALPWPLASECCGTVVLQHVLRPGDQARPLLEECARVLAPGGSLWVLVLNPLAPYRWRWRRQGLHAAEPLGWRRRLRQAGLSPASMSQGIGPRWQVIPDRELQDGPGLRAAYVLRADKRNLPMTLRRSPTLRLAGAIS